MGVEEVGEENVINSCGHSIIMLALWWGTIEWEVNSSDYLTMKG